MNNFKHQLGYQAFQIGCCNLEGFKRIVLLNKPAVEVAGLILSHESLLIKKLLHFIFVDMVQ